jgi:simple sugar transport system ATP-binding protein
MEQAGQSRPYLVEMRNISKSFGPVQALQDVHLVLRHNEVLGLVGDNGAGKSTLMKVLTGVYQPDRGEIYLEGQRVHFHRPEESREAGIEMVYQDLGLAGNLSIAANIYLGRERTRPRLGGLLRFLDHKGMADGAMALLDRLHIDIESVETPAEVLSGGQRQAVAIARSIAFDARVVIMDEPTAALAVKEVGKVLDLVKNLKRHHVSVILISHRMQDIFEVCDRIMVLRQGRKVGDLLKDETTMDEIVALITGVQSEAISPRVEVA